MPDLEPNDVAEALALDLPADLDTAPLVIPDKRIANRALRRLAILDREQAEVMDDAAAELAAIDALVQPERDRITEYVDDRLHGIQRARDWALAGLEHWMRAVNADDPSLVTVKVMAGETRLRPNPPRIVVTDDAQVAAALPTTAKAIAVAPAAVKKLVKPSGHGAGLVRDGVTLDLPEGYHSETAVDADGVVVPGVVFLVADAKRFEWDAS